MKLVGKIILAGAITLASLVPVVAAENAADWIRQMSRAMDEQTYEGTFVYLHGNMVETLRIVHDHDEMGVREKLSSLNGEARVIIRDSDNVTCIWPGSKSVIVSKSRPRTPFPQFDTDGNSDFARFYNFMISGEDRVAGRESVVVAMMPVDSFRYGYKLWVDKESRLLLRSMMLDMHENVIEQVMFTDLQLPEKTEDGIFSTDTLGAGYQWKAAPENHETPETGKGRIEFAKLPEGFRKVSERIRPMPMDSNPVRHAVVSDGVAAVSVYVEYTSEQPVDEMPGISAMGAVHAYGKMFDKGFVTVVGEVPSDTVRLVAEAVVLK